MSPLIQTRSKAFWISRKTAPVDLPLWKPAEIFSQRRDQKSLENRGRRLGRPRDFCDLPIRRDEGRVVNTPLVFKRVLFGEEKRRRRKKRRKRVGRERGAGLGWRKGLSPRLEWKNDERRWR
ncbi:hypothetical protein TNCV_149961 [Trichonephila clavipes]|nr:hypothetical protein TNCV_149961 [Trichonephila clavipes]